MTPALHKIWCDEDEHYRYEHFADFNEWQDSEEGQAVRIEYGVDALSGSACSISASRFDEHAKIKIIYLLDRR